MQDDEKMTRDLHREICDQGRLRAQRTRRVLLGVARLRGLEDLRL